MLLYQCLLLALLVVASTEGFRKKAAVQSPKEEPIVKRPWFLSRWASSFRARLNRMFGRLDAITVQDIYFPMFNEGNRVLRDPFCVEGLNIEVDKTGTDLKLTHGTTKDLKVGALMTRILTRKSGIMTGSVEFVVLPTPITFDFMYTGRGILNSVNKQGNITLTQDGPLHIKYIIQTPNSLKEVRGLMDARLCIATVKTLETNFNKKELKLTNVQYSSLLGFTERELRQIVADVNGDLKKNVETAIVHKIDTIFREFYINCNQVPYKLAINPASRTAENCDFTRQVYRYNTQ